MWLPWTEGSTLLDIKFDSLVKGLWGFKFPSWRNVIYVVGIAHNTQGTAQDGLSLEWLVVHHLGPFHRLVCILLTVSNQS